MIDGSILIGGQDRSREQTFRAVNPATDLALSQAFSIADAGDVADACALAEAAFTSFSALAPDARATFLERVASEIEAIGDGLILAAMEETGLPRPRLENERNRTAGQLRLFARVVREGDWLDATIDPALPDRVPPRADLRRYNAALGPVAVFGASNFPLAFSVAGGDTASAFAAGCPVVVKGHPAHPATGELVARAVREAVRKSGLHEGCFSYLPGTGNALGAALVAHPAIKAVGFTGSRAGGLALMRIAAERREPIPVYAEMSSINPVILLPHALAARAEAIGAAFVPSLTLGAGQFCTNPGIVIAPSSPDLDRFIAAAATALQASEPAAMLTPAIHKAYTEGVDALRRHTSVRPLASSAAPQGPNRAEGVVFETQSSAFLADSRLADEVFGAAAIIVRCADVDAMLEVIEALEGQLTATIQMDPGDSADVARLLPALQRKAGRVLANGWPTGVEVTDAMVHGGPYPATSDGRSTSVGSLAMARFLRPVCLQDMPDDVLPPALQNANPWGIARRWDGRRLPAQ